jgi:hypothetical protein
MLDRAHPAGNLVERPVPDAGELQLAQAQGELADVLDEAYLLRIVVEIDAYALDVRGPSVFEAVGTQVAFGISHD